MRDGIKKQLVALADKTITAQEIEQQVNEQAQTIAAAIRAKAKAIRALKEAESDLNDAKDEMKRIRQQKPGGEATFRR